MTLILYSLYGALCSIPPLIHVGIFEPIGSAIFPIQPLLSICEATRHAALAFWRVGTVEEGNVLIADISEPI